MKIFLTIIILGITLLLATTLNETNTTKAIHLDFDKLKKDSNSTVYLKIDDKEIELYTISSTDGRDIKLANENDEVHHIISTATNIKNKICIDDNSVVKVTLYNIKDEPIKNPNNFPKCLLVKKIQENGYRFDIEDKNKATLSIYIDKNID